MCNHLKDIDFKSNLRLENGLKIWNAMCEFRHPEASCFTAHVRPKPRALWSKSTRTTKKQQVQDDVFFGSKNPACFIIL